MHRTGIFGMTRRLGAALAVAGLMAATAPAALAQGQGPFRIGHLADMSGVVADLSGPGSTESIRMAIEDFGGKVLGRDIELVVADHRNNADVGISTAREWYDSGVNAIFDIGITSVALAVQQMAREKDKAVVFLSTASADLTGQHCSPNGVHWTFSSYSQAKGVVDYVASQGLKDWYFLTVDYAYGHNVERDTTAMIEAAGGKVLGATRHPFEATDYSSDLLQAQASKAQVIGLATTTGHVATIVKQAEEFGLRGSQGIAPLSLTLHDTKAMGLATAQGLIETAPYYWDQNDDTRAFAQRYKDRFGKMPNMVQASAYGAVMHYLKSVEAAGTDATDAILKVFKDTPVNDFMTKDGKVRADGRMMRTNWVFQVKTPAESTGEWDIYKQVAELTPEQAYGPPRPDVCDLVR